LEGPSADEITCGPVRGAAPPADELMRIASTFFVETTAAGAAYQFVSPTRVK
jgi:hypothetical protein